MQTERRHLRAFGTRNYAESSDDKVPNVAAAPLV
jgi:hypothetical protein